MCKLKIGDEVILVSNMNNPPKYFSKALGSIKVKSLVYHDGNPSEYALKFGPNGMSLEPGWRVDVELEVDVKECLDHCGPFLKLSSGRVTVNQTIHEKWLVKK